MKIAACLVELGRYFWQSFEYYVMNMTHFHVNTTD